MDAGAVCEHYTGGEHAESQRKLGIDMEQMTIIGETEYFPTKVFAVRKSVGEEIAARIVDALLGLDRRDPADAEILFSAELGGFQRADDKDYDGIRELIGSNR